MSAGKAGICLCTELTVWLHVHITLLRSVVLYWQQCKCKVMSSRKDNIWSGGGSEISTY